MINIRTPHDVTFFIDNKTGTPSKINYSKVLLKGVKFDEVTAYMISRNGYSADDTARVIIYLQDVNPRTGWDIKPQDFFIFGDIPYSGESLKALKMQHRVHIVRSVTRKTNSIPMLHHIEVVGG